VAHLLGNLVALLSGNILTVLSGHILALLSGYLITDLSGLIVALLTGNNSGNGLLNLVALGDGNWTAERLVNSGTFLISNIISVWNLDGLTILFGYIYAVLLGHLVADLSRLVPALLSGFIPTLLFSINIAALLLYNCGTLSLSSGGAHFLVYGGAFLGSYGAALLLISVFSDWLLYGPAALLRDIMALFLSLKVTSSTFHIVNLGLSYSITYLFVDSIADLIILSMAFLLILGGALLLIFSVALLLVLCVAFLFRNTLALLLWYRLCSWNLNSMALLPRHIVNLGIINSITLVIIGSLTFLLVRSSLMRFLNSITLLSGFIPAFILPDCLTGRDTSTGYPSTQ